MITEQEINDNIPLAKRIHTEYNDPLIKSYTDEDWKRISRDMLIWRNHLTAVAK